MLTINISYTGFNLSMPIAQSKRKLIAATALFIAVGAMTGAIATGGAATISFAQTQGQQDGGGATTGQQGGGGGQERIVRQGTITSIQDPLPGHEEEQAAILLPLRQDGSIYSGVLTYTASAAVEVFVANVQTLNETEQSMLNVTEDGGFGTLLTSPLDNQTSLAVTIITPPYGDTPVPSASIPFAGNALWLHTLDGTPFVANYAVSAQVLPAETQNSISNASLAVAEEDGEAAEDEEAGAAEEEAGAAEEEAGAAEEEAGAAEEEAGAAEEEAGADAEDGADTDTTPTAGA